MRPPAAFRTEQFVLDGEAALTTQHLCHLRLERRRPPTRYLPTKPTGGMTMDWNRVEGNWKEMKGKVKEQWGKLTDDDLDVINGKQDQLEGRLQQRYGYAKDQAQKEINDWYGRQRW